MADNFLDSSKENLSQPAKEGLTEPQAKSPLEDSIKEPEQSESTVMPSAPPVEPPVTPNVPSADINAPVPSVPESTPAPDTDEFLKSILADDKSSNQSDQTSSAVSPDLSFKSDTLNQTQELAPNDPTISVEPETIVKPPATEIPEPVSLPPTSEAGEDSPGLGAGLGETPGEIKIKDETHDLGGISAPVAPLNENKGSVSNDLISSMQKNASSGGQKKLLSLIVIVAIVAIGGYSIYSMFFAKSSTSTSTTQTSASPTASDLTATTEGTVAGSDDLARKSDLALIQQALINYSKDNNGSYPISTETASLSSPGNILETSLMPKYLTVLPSDPDTTKYFGYKSVDGTTFSLTAVLDNVSDPEAQVSSGKAIYTVDPTTVVPSTTSQSSSDETATTNSAQTDSTTSDDFGF